jgi:hypothetical protein
MGRFCKGLLTMTKLLKMTGTLLVNFDAAHGKFKPLPSMKIILISVALCAFNLGYLDIMCRVVLFSNELTGASTV